ncbi:MAG: phosphate/phosphite/phosphonate ABC transporter substrate-binding protein [Candidatus Thiodiazotropha sp. (ex Notomyrtea botanica)]|nr:phosphate/phosphite/phosphonate ABC transporter substrate-binding protein [Candidatus Thiodiazotropha sp. (ex Notomyrtea botanica)]
MSHPTTASFSDRLHSLCVSIVVLTFFLQIQNAVAEQFDSSNPYQRDTAYVGIMSRLLFSAHRTDTSIATEMTFLDFMKNIGKKGVFKNYSSPDDVLRDMKNHRLDAILTNPLDYIDLAHQINPTQQYSLTFADQLEQQILLIVRKDLKITQLNQLANKRLAFPAGNQLGKLYLDLILLRNKLAVSDDFFSEVHSGQDLNSAIIDLFFNKVDAALVTDVSYKLAIELNPQLSQEIEIFASSIPMIPLVIGINRSVPSDFTQQVELMVDNLDNYPRTLHLLSLFKANRIVRINKKQLEPIRALKAEYESLLSKNHK